MKVSTICKTDSMVVKAVWLRDQFFYSRTYWLDDEGFAVRQVTVYADGTVDDQDTGFMPRREQECKSDTQ